MAHQSILLSLRLAHRLGPRRRQTSIPAPLLVGLVALVLGAPPAAADVLKIDAACVAVGCYPGDGPGFPVEIPHPGSYRLTSNLDTRTAGAVDAITIAAPGVSLDLDGFAIIGGVVCERTPPSCPASTATGVRVLAKDYVAVTIHDGAITGYGTAIKSPSHYARLYDLRVWSNSTGGIEASGKGNQVFGVTAFGNGGFGIALGDAGMVRRSTVYGSGTTGVWAGAGSLLVDNNLNGNGVFGVVSHGKSLFARNAISASGGEGIRDEGGASLAYGNTFADNGIALNGLVPTSAFTENVFSAGSGFMWLSLGQNACNGAPC